MSSAVLAVRIIADARQAQKELKSTGKEAGAFGKAVNAGAVVGAAGLGLLAGYAVKSVKAAAEDAQSQAMLATALKNSAGAHDDAIKSTEAWISKTSLAAGVADDELRPALASLVRATGDTATAQDALNSALDISAATGQDVQSVSKALAKGYAGSTTALGKLGLGIDKATLKSGDMGAIMAQVNKTVGGASAANAKTAAGEYARLHVALNETSETLGGALLPALTAALGVLAPMLGTLSQNQTMVYVLAAAFGALSAALVVAKVVLTATTKGTALNAVVTKAAAAASKIWAAAQWLLNAALDANPIGIVVLAVAALVAIIVVAYKKSDTFRRIVNAAFGAVLGAARATWTWIKANWPLLLAILTGPFGVALLLIVKNFDKIKKVAKIAFDFVAKAVSPVVDAFKTMLDWIQKVIDLIGKIHVPKIKLPFGIGGKSVAAPSVSGLGRTGGSSRATASTSGGVSVYVMGAVDPQGTARAVQRLLHTADVRAGRRRLA